MSATNPSEDCEICGEELSGDDLTYRVLYGRFHHAHDGVVSEKQVAQAGEELDPGTDERYYCFDCYKQEFDREAAAHFEYESADELWDILSASNGSLVIDTRPLTIGGRAWIRVVDGDVEARHSIILRGGEDDGWDIGFETEPTEDFDEEDFRELFASENTHRMVYLKPLEETPLVSGQNHTLSAITRKETE